MKLIIDIPEDEVNECKMQVELLKQEGFFVECLNTALKFHVAYGKPLPKGHGRLIDADELDITTITTDDYSGNDVLDVVLKEDVDDAPTIIEADNAESEDKE